MLELKSIQKKSKTSVKKSPEKQNRQNVPEEIGKAKILHKKTHVYNNCFKLRLRAISSYLLSILNCMQAVIALGSFL